MSDKLPLIVVAGQTPPPAGGQNIMIERIVEELSADSRWRTRHLDFRFTPDFSTVRKARFQKIIELFRVTFRAIRLRLSAGKADVLLFPSGGPQTVPVVRDILLLPIMMWLSRSVWIQFHAAGIAERLKQKSGLLEKLLLRVHGGIAGAIVMTDFNRCDPESLGIARVRVMPHRIKDLNMDPQAGLEAQGGGRAEPCVNILYAGHLYDQKGTPQLVDAFGTIAGEFPNARLILMGEFLPPYSEDACKKRLRALRIEDRVQITGVLRGKEKDGVFRSAGLFVFPSIAAYESFGLVMAEAMMWGLPIVATDWRGNRDVAGPDAWYCPVPKDLKIETLLAEALRTALRSRTQWPARGEAMRRRFVTLYSENPQNPPYRNLVSELLGLSATR